MPGKTSESPAEPPSALWQPWIELAEEVQRIALGQSTLAPQPKDHRFDDEAWTGNPFYHALLQSYLAWGRWLDETVDASGLSHTNAARTHFLVSQMRDALAPTNFFWSNPAAVRHALETGGASTVRGLANYLDDMAHNGGMPAQVDRRPFVVGKTMAITPGAVVHRSEMFELIQYAPQTQTVYTRPLLSIPPQVNRYYASDLAPGRSLFEYLVKQGQQLFTIVWRNPSAEHKDWGFDAYMQSILEATDVIRDITGSEDLNSSAACAGGMTQAMLLAHLAATGDKRFNATSYLVTMFDASIESPLNIFAEPLLLEAAEKFGQQSGIITGQQLSQVFAWLRPNDLIWNYWANNYMLGEDPPAFDVLAWNADATRLTAQLQNDIIDVVKTNGLAKPGTLTALGTPVDLTTVTNDAFVVAAMTDHIAVWEGCYAATQVLGGKVDFVLSASGHIQSIVCPPDNPKARYLTNPEYPEDPKAWRQAATEHRGSWWEAYAAWVAERADGRKPAPKHLGNKAHPVLAPAPGTYVLEP